MISCHVTKSVNVVRNKKWKIFLLPSMTELCKTNRVSHFLPFYNDFNFEDWIFHSVVICRPGLCKREGIMKTRMTTIIDGYPLRLALLLEKLIPMVLI